MSEPRPGSLCICRCEEIDISEVRDAIAEGARSINDVKRRTRAGMGICQGIFCADPIADLIASETGLNPGDIPPMTARPPVRLIPLGLLAAMED